MTTERQEPNRGFPEGLYDTYCLNKREREMQFISNLTLLLIFLKYKDSNFFEHVGLGYILVPMILVLLFHLFMSIQILRMKKAWDYLARMRHKGSEEKKKC